MRPALKAGLRPLWRDRDTLQIGVDPRRARALTGLGKAAAIVSLLDGSRDTAEVARTAATYGIGQDAVDKILGLLASAGVLDDFPAGLRAALPGYLRERITPELACAALAYGHGDGGAAVLYRDLGATARSLDRIHPGDGENWPRFAPPPEHPISSQVDGELRELRIRFAKTRYRILYRRSGLLVVLLHIFEKNTDKLPARDRELAIRRFTDFKARMGAEPRRPPRAAGRDAPPRSRGR